jgi:hypothetical protein
MALKPLSADSKIVVYNPDTHLIDKTASANHQGVPISDILGLAGTDQNDFVSNVVLNGTDLEFTGTNGAFSGTIDLSPISSTGAYLPLTGGNLTGPLAVNGQVSVNYAPLVITSYSPLISLYDTNDDSDYTIRNNGGVFQLNDITRSVTFFSADASGDIQITAPNTTIDSEVKVNGGHWVTSNSRVDGDLSVVNTAPRLVLTDTNGGSFYVKNDNTELTISDSGIGYNWFSVRSTGTVQVHETLYIGGGQLLSNELMTLEAYNPIINLVAQSSNTNYQIKNDGGKFAISDPNTGINQLTINSSEVEINTALRISGGVVENGVGASYIFEPSQNNISMIYQSPSATTYQVAAFYTANGGAGSIDVNNNSTAYTTSSDYRLKENVVAMESAASRVSSLNPVRFNFISDATKTVDGFLAHEVQEVVPEAVVGAKDAVDEDGEAIYQGIDQSKLVPLLTAALKEALVRIEALEAQVGI